MINIRQSICFFKVMTSVLFVRIYCYSLMYTVHKLTLTFWLLGYYKDNGEEMVAVEFVEPSRNVQDSQQGAFVVRREDDNLNPTEATVGNTPNSTEIANFKKSFVFDPHLRMECMFGMYIKTLSHESAIPLRWHLKSAMWGENVHVCISAYIVPHFYAVEFSDCVLTRLGQHIKVHLYSLNCRATIDVANHRYPLLIVFKWIWNSSKNAKCW